MGDLSGIEPPRMNWLATDLPTEFRSFRQYCELIFSGPFAEKGQSERVTYILLWVGQEGRRMYNTWDLSETDKKDVEVIWAKFQALIEPKSNYRLSRFHLQKFRQLSSETVDEFMTRCKTQARKWKFRDTTETEERLIEQLVVGVRHGKVQEKLLCRDETLTLDAAMDVARTHEATLANMQQFSGDAIAAPVTSAGRGEHMSQADVERRHLRAQNVDVIMRPQIDVQQRAVSVTHVGNSITGSEYVGRLQVGRLAPEEDHTLLGDQDPELGQDDGPTEMSANEVVSTPSVKTPDSISSATTSSRLLLIPSTSTPSRGTKYMRFSGSR